MYNFSYLRRFGNPNTGGFGKAQKQKRNQQTKAALRKEKLKQEQERINSMCDDCSYICESPVFGTMCGTGGFL